MMDMGLSFIPTDTAFHEELHAVYFYPALYVK